mgnify:CR=1 FL=1
MEALAHKSATKNKHFLKSLFELLPYGGNVEFKMFHARPGAIIDFNGHISGHKIAVLTYDDSKTLDEIRVLQGYKVNSNGQQ